MRPQQVFGGAALVGVIGSFIIIVFAPKHHQSAVWIVLGAVSLVLLGGVLLVKATTAGMRYRLGGRVAAADWSAARQRFLVLLTIVGIAFAIARVTS